MGETTTEFLKISVSGVSDGIEKSKKIAAFAAVDDNFPDKAKVVGIGSGSTVIYVVERICQLKKLKNIDIDRISFVPTGFESKQLLLDAGLNVSAIEQYSIGDIDVAFDGADEIDLLLNCIKGKGTCLFQEKLVSNFAKKFVIIADWSKRSRQLGTLSNIRLPIEVICMAHMKVQTDLIKLGARDVTLRQGGKEKAGPVVTDNGNFILDADFGIIEPESVSRLHKQIKLINGVVETGLFDNATMVYFGEENNAITCVKRGEKERQ